MQLLSAIGTSLLIKNGQDGINTLEKYNVPKELVKAGFPKKVGKVYRDEDEFSAASDLHKHIIEALDASKYLIVLCSRDTPKSKWVDQEISYFRSLGRGDQILALLVDGEPDESFPEALWLTDENGERLEPAAADVRVRPDQKQKETKDIALMRIVAGIVGCGFDELRRRDLIRRQKTRIAQFISFFSVVTAFSLIVVFFQYQAISKKNENLAYSHLEIAEEKLRQRKFLEAMQFAILASDTKKSPKIEQDAKLLLEVSIGNLEREVKFFRSDKMLAKAAYFEEQNIVLGAVFNDGNYQLKSWDAKRNHSESKLLADRVVHASFSNKFNVVFSILEGAGGGQLYSISSQQTQTLDNLKVDSKKIIDCIFENSEIIHCVHKNEDFYKIISIDFGNMKVDYSQEERIKDILVLKDTGMLKHSANKVFLFDRNMNEISSLELNSYDKMEEVESKVTKSGLLIKFLMDGDIHIWSPYDNKLSQFENRYDAIIAYNANFFLNEIPVSNSRNHSNDTGGWVHVGGVNKSDYFGYFPWLENMNLSDDFLFVLHEKYDEFKSVASENLRNISDVRRTVYIPMSTSFANMTVAGNKKILLHSSGRYEDELYDGKFFLIDYDKVYGLDIFNLNLGEQRLKVSKDKVYSIKSRKGRYWLVSQTSGFETEIVVDSQNSGQLLNATVDRETGSLVPSVSNCTIQSDKTPRRGNFLVGHSEGFQSTIGAFEYQFDRGACTFYIFEKDSFFGDEKGVSADETIIAEFNERVLISNELGLLWKHPKLDIVKPIAIFDGGEFDEGGPQIFANQISDTEFFFVRTGYDGGPFAIFNMQKGEYRLSENDQDGWLKVFAYEDNVIAQSFWGDLCITKLESEQANIDCERLNMPEGVDGDTSNNFLIENYLVGFNSLEEMVIRDIEDLSVAVVLLGFEFIDTLAVNDSWAAFLDEGYNIIHFNKWNIEELLELASKNDQIELGGWYAKNDKEFELRKLGGFYSPTEYIILKENDLEYLTSYACRYFLSQTMRLNDSQVNLCR